MLGPGTVVPALQLLARGPPPSLGMTRRVCASSTRAQGTVPASACHSADFSAVPAGLALAPGRVLAAVGKRWGGGEGRDDALELLDELDHLLLREVGVLAGELEGLHRLA